MRGANVIPLAECNPTFGWHGFAMQDTRALPSKGFRRRYAAWRVTFERPKVTKSLLPRQTARFAGSLVSFNGSDGAPQMALWPMPSMASTKVRFEHPCSRAKSGRAVLALIRFGPYAGCAIIPDGDPDPLKSTRRIAGGTNTVPARGFNVHVGRLFRCRGRAVHGIGEMGFWFG